MAERRIAAEAGRQALTGRVCRLRYVSEFLNKNSYQENYRKI